MSILSRFWKRAQPGITSPEFDDGERVWSSPDQQVAEIDKSKWYNNEWWYEITLDDGTTNVLPENELARVVDGYALVSEDGYMKGFTEHASGSSQGYWGDLPRPEDTIVIISDIPERLVDDYEGNNYNDGYDAWGDFQPFEAGEVYTFDEEDVWGLPDVSEGTHVLFNNRVYTVDGAFYDEFYSSWTYSLVLEPYYAAHNERNDAEAGEGDFTVLDDHELPKFVQGEWVDIVYPINYPEPAGAGAAGNVNGAFYDPNEQAWLYKVELTMDSKDEFFKEGDEIEVYEAYLAKGTKVAPKLPYGQQQPAQMIPVGQRVNVVVPGRQTRSAIVIGHHDADEDGTLWYEIQYDSGETETIDGDSLQVEKPKQQYAPEDQRRQDFHPSLQDLMSHIKDTGTPYFPPTPEGQKAFEEYLIQQHNQWWQDFQQNYRESVKRVGRLRADILRQRQMQKIFKEAMKYGR